MNFRPENNDYRLWDTWFYDNNGEYHLFYLCNPASKPDEEWKPWDSIGHAVSRNLLDWEERDRIILKSGNPEDWDSEMIFTGNIFDINGSYGMTYGSHKDGVQKIGLLLSDDLDHWHKVPENPVMVPDLPYERELPDTTAGYIAFRDVTVKQLGDGSFSAIFCARLNKGSHEGRGGIGNAVSRDCIHWDMKDPVFYPGYINAPEVPDIFEFDGWRYLTFCTSTAIDSELPAEDYPNVQWSTFYASCKAQEKEFSFTHKNVLAPGDSYVGRIKGIGGRNLFFHHIVSQRPAFALPKEVIFLEDRSIRLVKWEGIKALEVGQEIKDFTNLQLEERKGLTNGILVNSGSECCLQADVGQCRVFLDKEFKDFNLRFHVEWNGIGKVGLILRDDEVSCRCIVMSVDGKSGELCIGLGWRKIYCQLGYEKKHRYKPENSCFREFSAEIVARSEGIDWFLNGIHIFTTVHDDAPSIGRIGFFTESSHAVLNDLRLVVLKEEKNFLK